MTLKDVLNAAVDPKTPMELTITTGNMEFCTNHSAGYLLENSDDELLEREILSLDVAGSKLSLELK